jgi:chromosome segregation ATPase
MKLQELAVANPTKQAAKVFESYFGNTVKFDRMTSPQARAMLKRVRSMIAEHRRTPEFHSSEQNPAYLKLVVMEQALATQAMTPATGSAPQQTPQQQQAAMTLQRQQKQRQLDDEEKQLTKQAQDITARKAAIQKEKAMMERRVSLKQRLQEASEVQQAQVVLASQDMVDQVQGMSEDISAMQFKDLPALVDQIKNEVGVDQAMQFNTDATAALSGLLQNLQTAKTQLEAALGVVTGQAPVVPGADMGAGLGAEMPAQLPAPGEEEIDVTDVDIEEPVAVGLGRERR